MSNNGKRTFATNGKAAKEARERWGWTQEQLSDANHLYPISVRVIVSIETGEGASARSIKKYAENCRVRDWRELLTTEEQKRIGYLREEFVFGPASTGAATAPECWAALSALSGVLSNKRVLFVSFADEERDPIVATTNAVEQVRQQTEVTAKAPFKDNARHLLERMQRACMAFATSLQKLPWKVRRNADAPMSELDQEHKVIINKALLDFRGSYICSLVHLYALFKFTLPLNLMSYLRSLDKALLPPKVFYRGVSFSTQQDVYVSGYPESDTFLRVATLADDATIGGIAFQQGSQLFFHDPLASDIRFIPWMAKLSKPHQFGDVQAQAGAEVYFDLDGKCTTEKVVED